MSDPHRILFVTPVSPFSVDSGAEQRSALLMQALDQLGTVDVIRLTPGAVTRTWHEDDDAQHEHAGRVVLRAEVAGGNGLGRYRPKPALGDAIARALPRPLSDYGLIVGRYLWSLCQIPLPANVPSLIDLDDLRYRYAREVAWSPALIKERCVKALNFLLAKRQLSRFDAAFVVSERDKKLLPGMPVVLLPNVPWRVPEHVAPLPSNKRLLFVGSLWYRPNADGIDWFLARVWPAVRTAEPAATLTLIGPAPPARRQQWERHPGVDAPGFVEDLAAAYAQASLVVVPVNAGGGSNIKILEAMVHGRPCVVTSLALDAFRSEFVSGVDLLEAGDSPAFASAVTYLLRFPSVAEAAAQSGMRAARSSFVPHTFRQRAADMATTCLQRRDAVGSR